MIVSICVLNPRAYFHMCFFGPILLLTCQIRYLRCFVSNTYFCSSSAACTDGFIYDIARPFQESSMQYFCSVSSPFLCYWTFTVTCYCILVWAKFRCRRWKLTVVWCAFVLSTSDNNGTRSVRTRGILRILPWQPHVAAANNSVRRCRVSLVSKLTHTCVHWAKLLDTECDRTIWGAPSAWSRSFGWYAHVHILIFEDSESYFCLLVDFRWIFETWMCNLQNLEVQEARHMQFYMGFYIWRLRPNDMRRSVDLALELWLVRPRPHLDVEKDVDIIDQKTATRHRTIESSFKMDKVPSIWDSDLVNLMTPCPVAILVANFVAL